MLRGNAKFVMGLSRVRVRALNGDMTRIKVDMGKDGDYVAGTGNGRIIGGTGPFDFSGVADTSDVPMSIKFDSGAVEVIHVDVSGAVDDTAVTVDELSAAINTAAPTDMTASKEAVTLRLLMVYSGTDDPDYIQVYGECAELGEIGQGLGQQIITTDTSTSFAETPTEKADETITASPATGAEVDVIIEGYKKGFTGKLIETQEDFNLMRLIEGGTIDSSGMYHDPDADTIKKYFEVETFNPVYDEGPSKERQMIEWEQCIYLTCSGSVGAGTKEKKFLPKEYNIVGTNYTNSKGVRGGAILRRRLTIAQYNALDIDNV
jgi:hypothetical protein